MKLRKYKNFINCTFGYEDKNEFLQGNQLLKRGILGYNGKEIRNWKNGRQNGLQIRISYEI